MTARMTEVWRNYRVHVNREQSKKYKVCMVLAEPGYTEELQSVPGLLQSFRCEIIPASNNSLACTSTSNSR